MKPFHRGLLFSFSVGVLICSWNPPARSAEDLAESGEKWSASASPGAGRKLTVFLIRQDEGKQKEGKSCVAIDVVATAEKPGDTCGRADCRYSFDQAINLDNRRALKFLYRFSGKGFSNSVGVWISLCKEWGQESAEWDAPSKPFVADGEWHAMEIPFCEFKTNPREWMMDAAGHIQWSFFVRPTETGEVRFTFSLDQVQLVPKASGPDRKPAILFQIQPDDQVAKELAAAGFVWAYPNIGNLNDIWTRSCLKNFNIIVISELPLAAPAGPTEEQRQLARLLQWFVEQGGGLMLGGVNNQDTGRCVVLQNEILKPYGARVLREYVADEANAYRGAFLNYSWTDQIARHPLTQGVQSLFYPMIEGWGGTSFTNPIAGDNSWEVLVRGMPTATTHALFDDKPRGVQPATYRESPPLVAIKAAGKGRIALWPTLTTCTFTDGYHPIWDSGLILSGAVVQKTSQGMTLIKNLLQYLAHPSRESGLLGGYEPPPKPKERDLALEEGFHQFNWDTDTVPDCLKNCYKLLIGARTRLSSGSGTVAEYAVEAKKHGYNLLVVTEDLDKMTAEKWKQLKDECRKSSADDFLVVEGFKWMDEAGNQGILFGDVGWIDEKWKSEKYPDRIKVAWHFHHAYAAGGIPPIAVINAGKNPKKPWFLGKTNSMASYTYQNGKLVDDALELYLEQMRLRFDDSQLAVHLLDSPRQVANAAQPGAMQTYVRAEKIADVINNLRGSSGANTGWIWQVFVSSGPEIRTFQALNAGTTDLAVPGAERHRLRLQVSSKVLLKEIKLLDGHKLLRRFEASGTDFDRTMDFFHDRQRSYVAIATDAQGGRAISWCRWVEAQEQWFVNCSDNWNYMDGGKWSGTRYADPRGAEMHLTPGAIDTWHAQISGELPGQGAVNLAPSTSAVNFDKVMASRFGSVVEARYEGLYSSDASHNINDFAKQQAISPNENADVRMRRTFFTSRPDQPRIEMYEGTLVLKKPVKLSPIGIATASTPGRRTYNHISYSDRGRTVVELRPDILTGEISRSGDLPKGGYVALWPDLAGGLGAFALDKGMRYSWWHSPPNNSAFKLVVPTRAEALPAGHKMSFRFLTVVGPRFAVQSGNNYMEWTRAAFGIGGEPWYRVVPSSGKVLSTFYVLKVKAEDGGFAGRFTRAELPSDLPVMVEGLNENWQAVVWYKGSLQFKRPEWTKDEYQKAICVMKDRTVEDAIYPGPVQEGIGYFGLDIELSDRDVFIGHPIICNNPEIRLQLLDWRKGKAKIEVHNPTPKPVACTVRNGKGFDLMGSFSKNVTVPAGQSLIVSL